MPQRPRYDAQGNLVAEAPSAAPSARPRFDAQGNVVRNLSRIEQPAPTAPSREVPERQAVVREGNPAPNPPGHPFSNLTAQIGNWFAGNVGRDEDAGEITWQPVPESDDVRWQGGVLSSLANALPRPLRTWLDAEGRSAAIGAGFFLDPNEEHRAEIIAHQVPTAQFRRDEYGQLQVRYNEQTPWAYLNRPGASAEDAQTAANEIGKYLIVRRLLPGGSLGAQPGATTPLLSSTVREAAAGGLSVLGGQSAATMVGGPGPDALDVALGAGGAAAGNVAGHGLASTVRGVRGLPTATRNVIDWVADRLPGGAQRAAERQAAAQEFMRGLEEAARRQAAETVNANAAQLNLSGEALARAVRQAEEEAVTAVHEQASGSPQAIDQLAREFGVRLTRAQTEGDIGGMQFFYEAAGGLHGPAAQRAATAFLAQQNAAIRNALRNIVPNPLGVSSPEAAVNVARSGMERAYDAAQGREGAAWDAFDDAVQRVRTFDQTPQIAGDDGAVVGGNPSGLTRLRANIMEMLQSDRKFFRMPEGASEDAQSVAEVFRQTFPLADRALTLIEKLEPATRADVPLRDVERAVLIKRQIDTMWEQSGENLPQRRLLSRMNATVRDWLKRSSGAMDGDLTQVRGQGGVTNLARRAPVTAERLRSALGISQETSQTFRENPLVSDIVSPPPGREPPTDEEVIRRLFGGGRGGLNVSSNGVGALRAMKQALGPASPEWESIRQGAIQRITQGLDLAAETNQTPAIITTYNRINDAFRANREAMELLFTAEELARLRQAQRILGAMMPTPRNPTNPTNSGIVAGRASKGMVQALAGALRGVPGFNIAVGGAQDVGAAAAVNVETRGAPGPAYQFARALSGLWDVNRGWGGVGGAAGEGAAETTRSEGPP
jgi:hypothetical protein